jgi:hypothetical protein
MLEQRNEEHLSFTGHVSIHTHALTDGHTAPSPRLAHIPGHAHTQRAHLCPRTRTHMTIYTVAHTHFCTHTHACQASATMEDMVTCLWLRCPRGSSGFCTPVPRVSLYTSLLKLFQLPPPRGQLQACSVQLPAGEHLSPGPLPSLTVPRLTLPHDS